MLCPKMMQSAMSKEKREENDYRERYSLEQLIPCHGALRHHLNFHCGVRGHLNLRAECHYSKLLAQGYQ
jgi:hypothetical protein